MKTKLHYLICVLALLIFSPEAHSAREGNKAETYGSGILFEGAIEALILVDAETNEDLYELREGLEIDMEQIKNRKLSIRLRTTFSEDPQQAAYFSDIKIDLKLEGAMTYQRSEKVIPYALFGDIDGNYNGRIFPEGNYSIWVGVDDSLGEGFYWDTRKINFSVGKVVHNIAGFNIIRTEFNYVGSEVEDGDMLNYSENPLSFEARPGTYKVGSMVMELNGPMSYSATENVEPFTLFGDSGGEYYGQTLPEGNYTLTATPYSETHERGKAGTPLTISFSIEFDRDQLTLSFYTDMVDAETGDRLERIFVNDPKIIDKNIINTDNVNFIVYPLQSAIGSVHMAMVGPVDSFEKFVAPSHIQRENIAPYTMFGDFDGDLNGKSLAPGLYRIFASPYTGPNSTGNKGVSDIYEFEIIDSSFFLKKEALSDSDTNIRLFPNPSGGVSTLQTGENEIIRKTVILDIFGKKVKEFSNALGSRQAMDLSNLSKGLYFVQVDTGKGQITKKLVVK